MHMHADPILDETLAVHQLLLNSKPPAATTVKAMKGWFLGQNTGKTPFIPQLFDSSKKRFEDPNDLVALRVPADQDRLSEFIMNHFGAFFTASHFTSLRFRSTSLIASYQRQMHRMATQPTSASILSRAAWQYSVPCSLP